MCQSELYMLRGSLYLYCTGKHLKNLLINKLTEIEWKACTSQEKNLTLCLHPFTIIIKTHQLLTFRRKIAFYLVSPFEW